MWVGLQTREDLLSVGTSLGLVSPGIGWPLRQMDRLQDDAVHDDSP
jgi:hypothetical protein